MDPHEHLKFPTGRFDPGAERTAASRAAAIEMMTVFPRRLRDAVSGLTDAQLDAGYRPGGWAIRQIVHHLADSHSIGWIRFKLALTEDCPCVNPYDQDKFARLADAAIPVEASLHLLDGVHRRWSALLARLSEADFDRRVDVPLGRLSLDQLTHMYGWHAGHHLAHIRNAARSR